jgi:hypothetical protein
LTRGRAATSDPFDLSAVNSSDELVDALSARRLDDHAETDDPAAALLTALVADVDAGAPPLPAPGRVGCGRQAARRRGTRAVVTFGVAALVLTSAGAAAAGGGEGVGAIGAAHLPSRPSGTERSNENLQRQDPVGAGRRVPVRRTADKRRTPVPDLAPHEEMRPDPEGRQTWDRRSRWSGRRSPADLRHSPGVPEPTSSSDDRREPGSWPENARVKR